jgi:putative ABC transport system ATP-binding protein
MTLILMDVVSKEYPMGDTPVKALEDIVLSILPGEFVAIWGPSGSGKSTLCNLIGLIDTPTKGTLFLEGQDTARMTDNKRSDLRSEFIGFVFQGFNLLPVLSAVENVMFPLEFKGEKKKYAMERAMALLVEMGIEKFSYHRPQKLSGGQQQRVAIARALVTQPRLVIADEPTANLDSQTAMDIIELMRSINRKTGTTFVFSTHDQRLLERVDRKILLRDGRMMGDERNGHGSQADRY